MQIHSLSPALLNATPPAVLLYMSQLETLAYRDALTGLHNRASFERTLAQWWQQGDPFAVAIVDADHLKVINDAHGHSAGDNLLRTLAGCIRQNARRQRDESYRLGGDEFALLVRGDRLQPIADRIREQLRRGRVDASLGVASASEVASAPALVALADQRMYIEKRDKRWARRLMNSTASSEWRTPCNS